MRLHWLVLLHVVWAAWQALLLGGTLRQLDVQAVAINVVPPVIFFTEPRREYEFEDVDSATVSIQLKLSDPARGEVDAELKTPADWFETSSVRIQIPAGETVKDAKLKLKRIPTPGAAEDFELLLGDVRGHVAPDTTSKHVVQVRNPRLLAAALTSNAPSAPIALQEPGVPNYPMQASFSLDLAVIPPRAARVEILLEGTATPNLDFQLRGDGLSSEDKKYFLSIPSNGQQQLRVEALHNGKEFNADPKRFAISFTPEAKDRDLTITTKPLAGEIVNSDRMRLKVVADANLNLYEFNTKKEVVFKLEPETPITAPLTLKYTHSGSSGLLDGDYTAHWEPSQILSNGSSASLRIHANDDDSSEQTETLTIRFDDGDDYQIVGARQFKIAIHDDDRKLIAGLDVAEFLEGNEAQLELKFDPPDESTSQVDIRLAQGDAARVSLLGSDGNAVTATKDSQGKAKYLLQSPGKYRISASGPLDNRRLDPTVDFKFEFIPAPLPEFQIPTSPLDLKLRDDESMGNVLVVVACTKYVRQRATPGEPMDPIFRSRFARIRQLGEGRQLVGNGVFFAGKSMNAEPAYLVWKGDPNELGQFAAAHSFVSPNDDSPDCLLDCLHGVSNLVQLYNGLGLMTQNLRVVVVWPSDEDPRYDACLANKMPAGLGENASSHFVWLGGDAGKLGLCFGPEPPIEGFYQRFPRRSDTLCELPNTSEQTLASLIQEILPNTPKP